MRCNRRSEQTSPGAIQSELIEGTSDAPTLAGLKALYQQAISPDAVARAIAYAIQQPPDVDINEIVLRPTAQEF